MMKLQKFSPFDYSISSRTEASDLLDPRRQILPLTELLPLTPESTPPSKSPNLISILITLFIHLPVSLPSM